MGLNKIQKTTLNNIIGEDNKDFLFELLEIIIGNGIGAVPKREIEVGMFYTLVKYSLQKGIKLSNYELSCLLKISETKVKNLKLEMGIRYSSNDEDESNQWLSFIDFLTNGHIEVVGSDKLIITIDDPYVLRFINNKLKTYKLPSTDYSFNSERITFQSSALKTLLSNYQKEIEEDKTNTKIREVESKLIKIKWLNFGKTVAKALFGILGDSIASEISEKLDFPTEFLID
jgi:hypothetical protein